ncbi:MAG: arginase [Bryobacteraceae bacterium]|nr:arginase [Bryobacteraceae bacterium]
MRARTRAGDYRFPPHAVSHEALTAVEPAVGIRVAGPRPGGVRIIGAPLDLGAGRRGVDMGPSAIRVANLGHRLADLGYEVEDEGNVLVDQPEATPVGTQSARYLPQIAATCLRIAKQVEAAAGAGQLPVVLGGDHSVAIGSVAGMARWLRRRKQKLGIVWVDAHADMNTPETSPSGNVHGMPLACCIGLGPPELSRLLGFAPKASPGNVALVGIRDVDQLEKPHVRNSGVRAFTMRHIDERGLPAVIRDAIEIAGAGTAGIHVSFDMDAIEPGEAPGVGTPVRGGLTYREAHVLMETLCDSRAVVSVEVVEVNPVLDEANRTAALAVELITSVMGKRIL